MIRTSLRYHYPLLTVWNAILIHNQVLFDIYKPRTATRGRQSSKKKRNNLILPSAFEHFLDTSKADAWRKIFENPAIFMGIKQKGNNVYRCLYISSSRPLSNIFYLLQVLAPGMLVISRKHQLDDADVKVSRVLPRPEWIQSSRVLNMEVMPGRTVALLAAAKDRKIAFHEERTTRPRYNSDRESEHTIIRYWGNDDTSATWEGEGYDWTVCDKDCGWCGRCQFW